MFIIPVIADIHGHRIEAFTLVSEIHEHVDLLLGIKNVFELEGVIDSCESCFNFLNRSIPFFFKEQIVPKPKEQKYRAIEAPFCRRDFRHGYSQNAKQMRSSHSHTKA